MKSVSIILICGVPISGHIIFQSCSCGCNKEGHWRRGPRKEQQRRHPHRRVQQMYLHWRTQTHLPKRHPHLGLEVPKASSKYTNSYSSNICTTTAYISWISLYSSLRIFSMLILCYYVDGFFGNLSTLVYVLACTTLSSQLALLFWVSHMLWQAHSLPLFQT